MNERRYLLVLHGITMSGASMVRSLGPLGASLRGLGFGLLAPNAAYRLEEVRAADAWARSRAEALCESFRGSPARVEV